MICFPNAKINLGLFVTEKRLDGFHNLESIFLPISLSDILEFVESKSFSFKNTGLKVDGDLKNNLCVKAYNILSNDYNLPAIKIHLHKIIPFGAGIGGGSSNATFMLKMLNQHFELNLSENKLLEYALQLGSDCGFFIKNTPSHISGRGEKINPIELKNKYKIVIIKPELYVSTKEAYSEIIPKKVNKSIIEILALPEENWKEQLINDFEAPIAKKYPIINRIKTILYSHGAFYASMSGSGSAVYGLFKEMSKTKISYENCYVWQGDIL